MEAIQPRVCIQPQSRRSPRYYITMIIRAPSRVFQFQDSQHSFKDCMDYILPGLHWKRFTTPCRRQHHCSLHCVAFPYLTAYIQESVFAKQCNSIFYPFFHSFSRTWRGAGNKKNSRHRTKGTEVEDDGWVSVAVYFSYFRREVWIFFFRGERRAQVIWLTTGTAIAPNSDFWVRGSRFEVRVGSRTLP